MNDQTLLKSMLMICCISFMMSCNFMKGGGQLIDGHQNVRVIEVERELPFPADTIWNTIFLDYGGASKFNPKVVSSGFLGDQTTVGVGAERFMYNDAEGEEGIHERIVNFDSEKKMMRFKIYEAKKTPVDTDVTYGESQLKSLGANRTLFKLKFQYRTTPKILAHFANGTLEKDFENMLIGIEHYLTTKEAVTAENFDSIAKLYE